MQDVAAKGQEWVYRENSFWQKPSPYIDLNPSCNTDLKQSRSGSSVLKWTALGPATHSALPLAAIWALAETILSNKLAEN